MWVLGKEMDVLLPDPGVWAVVAVVAVLVVGGVVWVVWRGARGRSRS
jgi:hypothetical protein